jgi:hypothetical protein
MAEGLTQARDVVEAQLDAEGLERKQTLEDGGQEATLPYLTFDL